MGAIRQLHQEQPEEWDTLSPPTIDLALDSFGATEIERRVVKLVCRVNGARSALRVAAGFRDATKIANHPTGKNSEFSGLSLQPQANSNK